MTGYSPFNSALLIFPKDDPLPRHERLFIEAVFITHFGEQVLLEIVYDSQNKRVLIRAAPEQLDFFQEFYRIFMQRNHEIHETIIQRITGLVEAAYRVQPEVV